jgi:hypothetical protein
MSIVAHISSFLTSTANKSMKESQSALRLLRNIPIPGFSITQCRSIWYSLMIYKYKADHNVPEELWFSARELMLTMLRGQDMTANAQLYLTKFEAWKERDFQSLINEMAAFYSQLLDIKDAIERTGERETIIEWHESYQGLIQKVRTAATRLNCLDRLDALVVEIQRAKKQYVFDMMHRAYWDMLEEELEKGNYTVLICQLNEFRDMLLAIRNDCPFDVTEPIRIITEGKWDHDTAWELYAMCMTFLCLWDSESHKKVYDESILVMDAKREETPLPQWTRMLMEKSTVLTMDLSTRKALWKLILSNEPNTP